MTVDPRPRRMSMDEDVFYRELMTSRPANPPSYESAMKAAMLAQRRAEQQLQRNRFSVSSSIPSPEQDVLPPYKCGVNVEGVFMRKMEIEETIKRAEYRTWQQVYVELHGTALNIYQVKKERGWWSSAKHHSGPDISPDNPPWIKKGQLEKSYSLLHADAGIAADYRKRRHVIRMRCETDQFLISCVELGTFVKWLESIFAAIDVAPAIDERDFPRDQSIPRIQRIRWFRGQRPRPEDNSTGFQRLNERRESNASSTVMGGDGGDDDDGQQQQQQHQQQQEPAVAEEGDGGQQQGDTSYMGPSSAMRNEHPVVGRLSTTSYPNEHVDPETGKWVPKHKWTETHDHLYAKLCYAVLLFKSPRKSNYIIMKGKRWYVDWATGRMFRVLPPAYGEVEWPQPFQGIHAENRLI
ncbi:hypothetical protein QBC46DRAFT_261123 [Diplogelasinospora grovesii]|uniref:Pleckstrin homology domain-containing protein n=1 Tax=Diplogelasinospora grovesii TaxID=303347 RepID=A0AAN6N730_9PEZI|nr:hypothetical protein QBC46DRAFT_261123 [Diplogelasinospora grovesii]